MSQPNHFQRFAALGYSRLVPIIPPDAAISPNSTLYKRVGTKQDGRGKTPGRRNQDGTWGSFDWNAYEGDEVDHVRWHDMGAGVGIKTGDMGDGTALVAIDADTKDHAEAVRDAVLAQLGDLAVRVGNYPKAAYICRVRGAFQYQRIEFGQRDENNRLLDRVEVLSDGRQFVAHGIHPKTGKPYEWPRDVPAYADLPIFEPAQITGLLETLRLKLPQASEVKTEGATTEQSQGSLRGEIEAVRRAVRATPNNHNTHPSRESYRDMGYAIKAALPDHPDEALDLFQEWCTGWTGPSGEHNDPDVVEADWRRMKGPYRRGASWLFDQAQELSGGEYNRADAWFEALPETFEEAVSLFDVSTKDDASGDVYPLLSLDEIMSREPPAFLVARHIPQVSVGFLYSTPGAGKSFLALDVALSLSCSFSDWHGDALTPAGAETIVLYIAAEGSFGFRNRVKAWCQARGIKSLPNRFLMIEKTIDFMSAEDIEKLLRTVRGVGRRPCLVIVDTVSRAMPGADENLQKEMTLFVRACDRLKEAFGCAVLGVHHAGKNGDMRGSTVLLGAGDFVFKLDRKQGSTIGRLTCEKQKDAPDGWTEPYRFETVEIGEGQTSLVPSRAEISDAPEAALTPETTREVLQAIEAAWESGEPWGRTHHAKDRFFERRMIHDFAFSAEQAADILALWIQSGVLEEAVSDKKSKRKGLRVRVSIEGSTGAGVFD